MIENEFNDDDLANSYDRGWEDCKRKVLKILSQPLQNLDLSTDECDSRYIEKIKNL
jgi:hypothetical protein